MMALDSNAMKDLQERSLPHFTPQPFPGSQGVNLFTQDLLRHGTVMKCVRRVGSTPDLVVPVRDLVGDIALCSLATHFALTVPLSAQVYNWVPA